MEILLEDAARGLLALEPFAKRDLATLRDDELATVLDLATRFAKLADVPALKVAAEVSRRSPRRRGGGMARKHGHRSANSMVAKSRGGNNGDANNAIRTGSLFDQAGGDGSNSDWSPGDDAGDDASNEGGGNDTGGAPGSGAGGAGPRYPHVREAVEAGDLSAAQASQIIAALDELDGADEELERQLVSKARTLSLDDLRRVCVEVVARWNQELWKERETRMRDERYLSLSERADGMVSLSGRLDPESAAAVKTWLDAQVKTGFQTRRELGLGPAEAGEAGRMRVDALVALARHGMRCDRPGSGTSTEVVIRLSESSLRTGLGLGTCDALSTPFSAGTLRRMAVDAKVIPLVLGGGSQPLDLGYAQRLFSQAQRHALAERDGGCAFCHVPVSWCDAHHIDWWKRDHGPTNLSNGVLLCVRCHHRIHDDGWEVEATPTEVWFVPPAAVDPARRRRQGGKAALHVPLR
ncbi:HNH endonuclease signature motif containing protein [Demequina pelophila]|uniref:HNH endonuclease signature motif containing protein n=1 Tax=Demequina pelophila TaxID=1638984 RepID=UPI000782FFF6|nr:HNH endonuclease signature motif containing protein [Demequina pelophila]